MSIVTNFINGVARGIEGSVTTVALMLKTGSPSYTDIQTADSKTALVTNEGSLLSVIELSGVVGLVGDDEYQRIHQQLFQALNSSMKDVGHTLSIHFSYNRDQVLETIEENYIGARKTANKLELSLKDVLDERVNYMSRYTSAEKAFISVTTTIDVLTKEQQKAALKERDDNNKGTPAFKSTQAVTLAIPALRDLHDTFVKSLSADLSSAGIASEILDVHTAVTEIRKSIDHDFTDKNWKPVLPGDKITPQIRDLYTDPSASAEADLADLLWPNLAAQIFPRDSENIDLKTCRIGGMIYSSIYIDLFPKDIQPFSILLSKTIQSNLPWKISFQIKGGGLSSLKFKRAMSSVLAFSSAQNRLIHNGISLLEVADLNTDDAAVMVKAVASTWAPEGDEKLLRSRHSQLSKAIQNCGSADVSEICGDAFEGTLASMLSVSQSVPSNMSVASLKSFLYMMPFFRPASPWKTGSLLLRSPDGKPWPYQPGSPLQTTWIDMIYARPGSGKSVLSNALNLGLCVQPGIERLPRIAIIDIGPSSAGLISLLQEALPEEKRHLAAYIRFNMDKEHSVNPFDTQLGSRYPLPIERSFLVNFITLLATPVGAERAYDGVPDLIGMVIDEAYKLLADDGNPNIYTQGVDTEIDKKIAEIKFVTDSKTTWWEVTDGLFNAGFTREATLAQRNAVPLLSDLTSIARTPAVQDLYGKITVSTGENLIDAVVRMISGAIREYPVLSRYTQFDIGESRVVSFDLDEVAKSGGDAADRQTAVMYMLARYILGKDFYLNKEAVSSLPDGFREYHEKRAAEIKEDQKRIVFDEFHRTSRAQAVRDQVIVDMREGRKWRVQVCVVSQDLKDFDEQIVKFATSTFIMDAGPEQAIEETSQCFGLSNTAKIALRQSVRGPREGGATFLGQFATKEGNHLQLLTLTLGPAELWAFSTTSEDVLLRNALYEGMGPVEARRVLSNLFPQGSAAKVLQSRLNRETQGTGVISEDDRKSVVSKLIEEVIAAHAENPNVTSLKE
ncbi:MAG: type IV secretion protein IcmB [Pseudomonadota bacterium]|nr:type IV secretion protein IcmB [Pseudomonadota bacterium]